jgi:hypothetical protein
MPPNAKAKFSHKDAQSHASENLDMNVLYGEIKIFEMVIIV